MAVLPTATNQLKYKGSSLMRVRLLPVPTTRAPSCGALHTAGGVAVGQARAAHWGTTSQQRVRCRSPLLGSQRESPQSVLDGDLAVPSSIVRQCVGATTPGASWAAATRSERLRQYQC